MDTYFLKSERLGFRKWTNDDLDLAQGLWSNPEVTRLIGGPFTPEQVKARLEAEIAEDEQYGVQYWPVFALADNEHVGCCGLRHYRPLENICEHGFHIRLEHQGHGYAYEAAVSVIRFAFVRLKMAGIFAGHHPQNTASRHLLLKLGFHYTHDELYPATGLLHPSYLLSVENYR
jgi:[ribosomal protein S5]-alanine N-acetyltransferase